jgi:uncharacterized SAM-binding protein YcdF (DUF218 family)
MRGVMRRARAVVLLAGLAFIALAAGFVAFAASVAGARPPANVHAQGIVVLTGGPGRIDGALRLLAEGRAKRLLISGVNPAVNIKALAPTVDKHFERALACCVDLGRAARDTVGNAAEARDWAKAKGYTSLIIVTSNYHMPRSMAELAEAMPKIKLIPYPVADPEKHLAHWWSNASTVGFLLREYGKYLLAIVRVKIGGAASITTNG